MTLLLWIVDHPILAALALCFGAAALAALLLAFVHFVLDPVAHGLARLVRDVREPSGRHRRIGEPPAPRGREVPPMPDRAPDVVRIPLCDPHDADTQPIPRLTEGTAA